jgi:hypothetical protein
MADRSGVSWGGIAVAVILLACCALCAPAHAGVSPDVGRYIGDLDNGTYAYIGETNLKFVDTSGTIITEGYLVSDWENSNINIPFPNSGVVFDSKKEAYRLLSGWYRVTNMLGVEKDRVYFASKDDLHVETLVRGVRNFGWVTRTLDITFEATTNLEKIVGDRPNYITYKLLDPDGFRLYEVNGVPLTQINVSDNGDNTLAINTNGLDLGVYRLSIVTDPNTNNGFDLEGPEASFEVRSKGITIEAEPKATVTKDIKFVVKTTPDTPVILNVTWGAPSKVKFKNEFGQDVGSSIIGNSSVETGNEGSFDRRAYFLATGSYEVTATELIAHTTDSISVEIVPYKAELKVDKDPSIYHIGENVKITCSADVAVTMGSIMLKIDDEIVASGKSVDGFDYTWNTNTKSPGSYKIAIWILPFSDPETEPPDAFITVILLRGGLFAEPSAPFVALGDGFTITGTVPGRDRVDILTIAPDGGGGRGLDPEDIFEDSGDRLSAPGLTYETTGVNTDGEFETEEIGVSEDVDTGTYLIAALNYGRDGIWGTSLSKDLLAVISNDYATSLGVKTTDQLLAILKDKTINAAGSDDLLGIATISVEQGFVTVDELEDVPLGDDLKVTGTTNRQVDTAIIVTVEGLDANGTKLKPKIAKATKAKEDEKTFYNSFDVTFDTESANIGTYQVTVDDGDGHTASTTMSILPAEEHSVNVSVTPSPRPAISEPVPTEPVATPSPTAATAPVPSSPAPEGAAKEPGFEALPALIALAVLGFLLVRSRQKR